MQGATGRVLVVDDDRIIRQLIKVNLELEGFEVVTAADGAECLELVHRARPDVITLDIVMPRLDGLRTAERLRADPLTRDMPVAIVSSCTAAEIDAETKARVDAVMPKPFEPAALVRLVRRLATQGRSGGCAPAPQPPAAGVSRCADRKPGVQEGARSAPPSR